MWKVLSVLSLTKLKSHPLNGELFLRPSVAYDSLPWWRIICNTIRSQMLQYALKTSVTESDTSERTLVPCSSCLTIQIGSRNLSWVAQCANGDVHSQALTYRIRSLGLVQLHRVVWHQLLRFINKSFVAVHFTDVFTGQYLEIVLGRSDQYSPSFFQILSHKIKHEFHNSEWPSQVSPSHFFSKHVKVSFLKWWRSRVHRSFVLSFLKITRWCQLVNTLTTVLFLRVAKEDEKGTKKRHVFQNIKSPVR